MIPRIRVYREAPGVWIADVSKSDDRVFRVGFYFWRDAFDYAFQEAQRRLHHLEPCS